MFHLAEGPEVLPGGIDASNVCGKVVGIEIRFLAIIQVCAVHHKALRRAERGAARHFPGEARRPLQRAPSETRQILNDRLEGSSKTRRQPAVAFGPVVRNILAISPEKFVPADAGEQYGHVLTCFAAHQVRSDDGRVGGGFVHVPHQAGQ